MNAFNKTGNCWPSEDQLWLLKAALFHDENALTAWNTWVTRNAETFDVVDDASYQLYPLVYRNLEKFAIQHPIYEKCKGIYKRNWSFNQLLWRKLLPYFQSLKRSGVYPMVLLKGMAMIVGHYHDVGMRTLGDVDVLIPIQQVPTAVHVLKLAGLDHIGTAIDITNPYELAINHAITYRIDAESYLDLHWAFLTESIASDLNNELIEKAISVNFNGIEMQIPDPTLLLLQTIVHGVKSTTVASLRWIADSVTLLKTADIDWNRFIAMTQRIKVKLPVFDALLFLETELNVTIPIVVYASLSTIQPTRIERFKHRCNVKGYFFIVHWLDYCERFGYRSWVIKMLNFPRFMQYRRRLPYLWQVLPYSIRWLVKKIV